MQHKLFKDRNWMCMSNAHNDSKLSSKLIPIIKIASIMHAHKLITINFKRPMVWYSHIFLLSTASKYLQ